LYVFCRFLSNRRRLALNNCGIDLGGVSSYVYLTTDRGRKLWSGPVVTTKEAFETRLQTMPKAGRIASLTFVAAADDVQRFPSSRKLVGYSGLAPTVRQSGERMDYGPISREGRRELRAVWVQIAHLVAVDRHRDTATSTPAPALRPSGSSTRRRKYPRRTGGGHRPPRAGVRSGVGSGPYRPRSGTGAAG
jgi:hypothetical protein